MVNKFKCWLGLHQWKTVVGDKEWQDKTHPSCRHCDRVYPLTQTQINLVNQLRSEIRQRRLAIEDITQNGYLP